jgi:hypothetical protein
MNENCEIICNFASTLEQEIEDDGQAVTPFNVIKYQIHNPSEMIPHNNQNNS